MYLFFVEIGRTALIVILVLAALSLLLRNFWCRYLCPYGALLGIVSWRSPLGIRRDPERCTGCGRCDRACPNSIAPSARTFVRSEECTGCLGCVDACSAPGALAFGTRKGGLVVQARVFAVLLLFLFVPRVFASLGYWQSETPPAMYKGLYRMLPQIDRP